MNLLVKGKVLEASLESFITDCSYLGWLPSDYSLPKKEERQTYDTRFSFNHDLSNDVPELKEKGLGELSDKVYVNEAPLPTNYYTTPDMDYDTQGHSESLKPLQKAICRREPLDVLITGNDCNGSVTLGWTAPSISYTGVVDFHKGYEVRQGQGKNTNIHEWLHWFVGGEEPVRKEVEVREGGKLQGPADFYSGLHY